MKKLTRGEYIVPGPNHLWAIDGHDKLAKYGIEIYAAIDAYSRHIQWFYVGNSNRTQLSVARQFLDAIEALDICPDFIRSDHGTETPLLADAQFSLYKAKLRQEGASEEELQAVQLRGCYWYGVSVRNVKIEGLWRRLIQQSTMAWMVSYRTCSAFYMFIILRFPPTVFFTTATTTKIDIGKGIGKRQKATQTHTSGADIYRIFLLI